MAASSPFVTPEWLHENLGKVKVLDATWYLPNDGRDGKAEFAASRIPGARYFDLNGIADVTSPLPHMLPSDLAFSAAADALGVGPEDSLVVYEREGLFAAPRVWWTWRAYGHGDVRLLEGGLAAWRARGYEVEADGATEAVASADAPAAAVRAAYEGAGATGGPAPAYPGRLDASLTRGREDVLRFAEARAPELAALLDARPAARWRGDDDEPRPGVAAGHVPGSANVPWTDVQRDGRLLSPDALREVFAEAGVDLRALALPSAGTAVLSCGSGVTACLLGLAIGTLEPAAKLAIYDGSWSEWGILPGVPVERGPAAPRGGVA